VASIRNLSPTWMANSGERSRVIVSVCPVDATNVTSPAHDPTSGLWFALVDNDGDGSGDGDGDGAVLHAASKPAVMTRPAIAGLQPLMSNL
jgi:hypothetical protein